MTDSLSLVSHELVPHIDAETVRERAFWVWTFEAGQSVPATLARLTEEFKDADVVLPHRATLYRWVDDPAWKARAIKESARLREYRVDIVYGNALTLAEQSIAWGLMLMGPVDAIAHIPEYIVKARTQVALNMSKALGIGMNSAQPIRFGGDIQPDLEEGAAEIPHHVQRERIQERIRREKEQR